MASFIKLATDTIHSTGKKAQRYKFSSNQRALEASKEIFGHSPQDEFTDYYAHIFNAGTSKVLACVSGNSIFFFPTGSVLFDMEVNKNLMALC